MKKSTIFLVALTYILAFVIVGFFGTAMSAYNPIVDVAGIIVTPVAEQETEVILVSKKETTDIAEGPNEYLYRITYIQDVVVKLKAQIEPANSSHKTISIVWDKTNQQSLFNVIKVDDEHFNVQFKQSGMADFSFEAAGGEKMQAHVRIFAQ